MSIDHIISGICNSKIGEVILIGDNIILLDYKYQLISLHVVDNRSRTQALSCCYLHNVLDVIDSLQCDVESTSELDSKWVSTPIGPSGPHFKLIYHDDTIYESLNDSRFTLVHKGILVITQNYTKDGEQGL